MQLSYPLRDNTRIVNILRTPLVVKPKAKAKVHNFKLTNRSFASDIKNIRTEAPNSFKKKNNLVESNKSNLQRLATLPSCQLSCEHNNLPSPSPKKDFVPVSLDQMQRRINLEVDVFPFNSTNLEMMLCKNKMKKHRNLLSYNILALEQKYNFSRFQLHNLYCVFHTLMKDSKTSISRFKRDFEVIFNMNKVAIRPETLEKIFLQQKHISFESFIDMYSKIDKTIFKQNIVDYVEILFEGLYDKDNIHFEEVIRIMSNRISEQEATSIAKTAYELLDRYEDENVRLKEITDLCHTCDPFAKKIYRVYAKEVG